MQNPLLFTAGIALILIGIVGIVLAIMQYRQKGPVLSAAYFAASKEEQQKMHTKKAYRYSAHVLIYTAMPCLFFGISFISNINVFAYIATILAVTGTLTGILFAFVKNKKLGEEA